MRTLGRNSPFVLAYNEILHMREHGKVHPEQLITREVSLEEVSDRLDAMTNYETRGIEVIIEF